MTNSDPTTITHYRSYHKVYHDGFRFCCDTLANLYRHSLIGYDKDTKQFYVKLNDYTMFIYGNNTRVNLKYCPGCAKPITVNESDKEIEEPDPYVMGDW